MLNSLTFFLMGVLAISEKDITQDYVFKNMGLWMHPSQQYVVRLHGCEDGMCGTVAWVAESAVKYDVNNKDVAFRGRPLCGLRIVNGLATDGHVNIYKKGKMYRTDNGTTTSVKASYLSSDEVQMHSYQGVSMIGDTQVWLRVNEKDYPPCTPVTPLPVALEQKQEESLSAFVEKTVSQPFTNVDSTAFSEPVVLTPLVSPAPTNTQVVKAVSKDAVQTVTTNSNFKTRVINAPKAVSQSSKKLEQQTPRVLTLEVVE
ncbi:MAG: hypothetical protein CMH31_03970 [Micavibrio sp.]|nr:hypothetical protein [Micavibrio sp.]|tara:strand:- start:141 stop:914 length:774 start_codon:yes stop_codon:yes gene_type:complete